MSEYPDLAYEFSDGIRTTFATWLGPVHERVHRLLGLLGEPEMTTLSVWKVPDGMSLLTMTRRDGPLTFLQCAGTADAMTIEWRRRDADGEERLYTVGRGGLRVGAPSVDISFHGGEHHTVVYPDEVFARDEAADIFANYVETLTVPDGYVFREFDLTWPKP